MLLVGGSRDRSPVTGDFFPGHQTVACASKNEYQDIPGGKDGRWVKVTTLPPSCAEKNLPEIPKATRPVVGVLLHGLTL